MKKNLCIIVTVMLSGILFLNACNNAPATEKPASANTQDTVKRGEYLVQIMGCHDCHSPKKMGPHGPELVPDLLLSGFPSTLTIPPADTNAIKNGWALLWADLTTAVGPWGQTYAANLTSDETGIGTWTLAQFKKALKEGKYKGLDESRPLMPPMPWQNYKNISDDDVAAIFAFLKSTKPVKNIPPPAKLNPPPPPPPAQ